MYDPPAYLWAITIAGPAAVAALTCIVLYGGAVRAGLGRRRAALLAGAAAVVFGGWLTASAVIAGHGWYHTLPWFPVAVTGYLGLLLALRRIPVVARALAAPGMVSRLEFRTRPAWPGWPSCSIWPSATCRRCSPARGPGRHRRRYRRAAGRAQARAGHRPRRRLVVQRVRHDRPGRGPDSPRPHRVPAAQRHPVQCADHRAAARADPDGDRAAVSPYPSRPCPRWSGLHGHRCPPPPRSLPPRNRGQENAARRPDGCDQGVPAPIHSRGVTLIFTDASRA